MSPYSLTKVIKTEWASPIFGMPLGFVALGYPV